MRTRTVVPSLRVTLFVGTSLGLDACGELALGTWDCEGDRPELEDGTGGEDKLPDDIVCGVSPGKKKDSK